MGSRKAPNTFHDRDECLHPEYHVEKPNYGSMVRLLAWFRSKRDKQWVARVAPLCEFGGAMWKSPYGYSDIDAANGTWAICPDCSEVLMCGYGPEGLEPKNCPACGIVLSLADYFQPVGRPGTPCLEEGYCVTHGMIHHHLTLQRVERAIMIVLREKGDLKFAELIAAAKGLEVFPVATVGAFAEDVIVREARRLMDQGELEMTSDRHLKIPA